VAALVVLICAYLGLQVWAIRRWQGMYAKLAWIPIIGWGIWLVAFVIAVLRDPSSHNLLPFEVAIGISVGFAFLALIAVTRAAFAAVRTVRSDVR
jgi:hypothetical protein